MHGLRAEKRVKTASTEGISSVKIARGAPAWTTSLDKESARRLEDGVVDC
jgi:hypothetical protein